MAVGGIDAPGHSCACIIIRRPDVSREGLKFYWMNCLSLFFIFLFYCIVNLIYRRETITLRR